MPKKAKEMSALDVRRLEHPGTGGHKTFAVGGVSGLLIQITPNNARSWVLRVTVGGKRREIGLGAYPDVTLAEAREAARQARKDIRGGADPVETRKQARADVLRAQRLGKTFSEVLEAFLAEKLKEFSSEKHRKQWRVSLDSYAVPVLGDMAVSDISVSDVLSCLAPIWETKTETASRLRGRIEMVLAYATVHGYRDGDNPARWKGNLDMTLAKPSKVRPAQKQPALSLADAPRWFSDVSARTGSATDALIFMALTGARSGEVRGMVWDEVDIANGLWTIPAERMKARREHRVTLSDAALEILERRPREDAYVFAAVRGGQLTDAAMGACMKRIHEATGPYVDRQTGRPAVPHGLRSTFRDWAAESGVDHHLAEIALAHNVGSVVELAYRRTDMVERRRAVMASWADFLAGKDGGKVVQIRA